jgi:hypothetical protein
MTAQTWCPRCGCRKGLTTGGLCTVCKYGKRDIMDVFRSDEAMRAFGVDR